MSPLARKVLVLAVGLALAACAELQTAPAPAQDCKADLERVNAQLAAEVAERQRVVRAATRREEALRKQLEALKAIERGIMEREERTHSKAR